MKEKIPNVTNKDIDRIICRDFGKQNLSAIKEVLSQYQGDSIKGRNRVWAAILKLSNREQTKITENLENAKIDFRDVIAYAESPNLSKDPFEILENKTLKNEVLSKDWDQYRQWFKK